MREIVYQTFLRLIRGEIEAVEYYENTVLNVNGEERMIAWHNQLLFDDEGKITGTLSSGDDVTDPRRIQQEHERLQTQLYRSQKLEALGRLAGGVAHDFNNLVTVIAGNASMALDGMDESNPVHELLLEISEASKRTAELTQQLLAFGRKQLIEPRVIDPEALLTELEKLLKRLIGEEIDMIWELDPAAGRIKADPSQIEQVIVNLVINARDAMAGGGKLTIETAHVELNTAYCETHTHGTEGSFVMLAVSDSGCGMNADELDQIFEPFFTTKRDQGGSGLGLATTFGIVRQHGGSIEVYSEVGVGTTFKIYLPRVEETAQPIRKPDVRTESLRGVESILVVEDESMVRKIAIRILAELGYSVREATDGLDALKMIETEEFAIDLLLTDVVMPGMNGRELAEKLKGKFPGLKVLYTSGYTENVIAHRGALDKNVHFISKPYLPQTLAAKVRETIDS